MESFDVLIAGGGPAGLAAAHAAASRGRSVLLVEQNKEIGGPIRTSGGSFLSELRPLSIPDRFSHPIRRLRFLAPTVEAVFPYDQPDLCVLDVRGLYQHLAEQAIAAGAQLRLSTAVTGLLEANGRVTGATGRNPLNQSVSWQAATTIDSTGHRSVLLNARFRRFGVGAEYDLYAPHCDQGDMLLLVGSRVAPTGYAWVFPWGNHRVRIGVGLHHGAPGDSPDHPLPFLDRLLSEAANYGVNLRGAQPIEYHHGLIPAEGVAPQLSRPGLLAVGDAGGQASALVGEGIRWAIQAGRLAGDLATTPDEPNYPTHWLATHGRHLALAHDINRRMTTWDDAKWDRRIAMLQGLPTAHFNTLLKTDFSPAALLHLAWKNPSLWATGFRELAGRLSLKA